jgi:hypothetical protein
MLKKVTGEKGVVDKGPRSGSVSHLFGGAMKTDSDTA